MSTWLIVADNSTARIFTMETRSSPINEIETIVHTEARLHEQDMTSDLPGKGGGKAGAGRHPQQMTENGDRVAGREGFQAIDHLLGQPARSTRPGGNGDNADARSYGGAVRLVRGGQ